MGNRTYLSFASALLLLLTMTVAGRAQVATAFAQLNGSVHDPAGAAVAKANITLRDVGTNQTFTTASNDMGFYVFPICRRAPTN